MKHKIWQEQFTQGRDCPEIAVLCSTLGILPPTAILLYNRGCTTPEKAREFISMEANDFHDPYLMSDMGKAVARIEVALGNHEKITIYGDYDVDGVTSVCALYLYLKNRGAEPDYYIPSRNGEGYGITEGALKTLAENGTKLLITVDTGITATKEAEYAKELGMDVIVTDHHECHSDIPKVTAVLNPKRPGDTYPFKELAGVGVVFKLLCALQMNFNSRAGMDYVNFIKEIMTQYGDLIAIGTVADVMPLIDENRLIVSGGLSLIEKTTRPGLAALVDSVLGAKTQKKKITSSTIGYSIAPRINAAGRISCASLAVDLFLEENPVRAAEMVENLNQINRERQNEENLICDEVMSTIPEDHDFEREPVIVMAHDNWHQGVIGIVCSRITDRFNAPSILVSFNENDIGKGSGRSVKGLNLVEALSDSGELLEKFGGHELAAGLSIKRENFDEFKKKINAYARRALKNAPPSNTATVECELTSDDITLELADELGCLEPYGTMNPTPLFILRDVTVADIRPIGDNRHTKMLLEKNGVPIQAVLFGTPADETGLCVGATADAVFNVDVNEFRGQKTVQLLLRDIFVSPETGEQIKRCRELFAHIWNGRRILPEENIIPERSDFARVFQYLRHESSRGRQILGVGQIKRAVGWDSDDGYVKIKYIILILTELNLLSIDETDSDSDDFYNYKINPVHTKVNLEKSSIYKKLRSRREKAN